MTPKIKRTSSTSFRIIAMILLIMLGTFILFLYHENKNVQLINEARFAGWILDMGAILIEEGLESGKVVLFNHSDQLLMDILSEADVLSYSRFDKGTGQYTQLLPCYFCDDIIAKTRVISDEDIIVLIWDDGRNSALDLYENIKKASPDNIDTLRYDPTNGTEYEVLFFYQRRTAGHMFRIVKRK